MKKTLAKTEPRRETTTWRIEERYVTDGQIVRSWHLGGAGSAEAWLWFTAYRETYPWRYTAHGARRLVLLAKGGAK